MGVGGDALVVQLGMDLASVACFGICIGSFPELRTYIAMGRTPFSPYLGRNSTMEREAWNRNS